MSEHDVTLVDGPERGLVVRCPSSVHTLYVPGPDYVTPLRHGEAVVGKFVVYLYQRASAETFRYVRSEVT